MSLSPPSIATLSTAIEAQLTSQLSTVPLLPKSFSLVIAKVLAGVFVILWKYAGWIFLQMFVAYATMDEVTINGKRVRPLVELGRQYGVRDPTAATRAVLVVEFDVTTQSGTLPAQTALLRTETGRPRGSSA